MLYGLFKIGFAPSEKVLNLKLIDVGVPKENIMIMQTGLYVIRMIIPVIAAKYTAGPKPMSIYLNIMPIKYKHLNINYILTTFKLNVISNCKF